MADSTPPAPTTIAALNDDILHEIFLRLPDITSLARAAFACSAFLHAVRSSPAFRRRFRGLRAPLLVALFQAPDMGAVVPAAAGKSSDTAAAFGGLLQDSDASDWRRHPEDPYSNGYASFVHRANGQCACYSPHSPALNIYPKRHRYGEGSDACLEFHTLSPDGEEKRPSRVVCVHRDHAWAWARVAVFSSRTMEWQVVLPEMETWTLLVGGYGSATSKVINGFVCWVYTAEGVPFQFTKGILALNTSTFQFSRMDLPPVFKVQFSSFQLGQTKDGQLCVVSVEQCMLSFWLWAADDDGVERFRLHKTFSLLANVSKITERSEEADVRLRPMAVINGFVYLFLIIGYYGDSPSREWFLSFCLETAEVILLHTESKRIPCPIDPYIMVSWPSSLIQCKEDSETRVTGHISQDDGPTGTEEASPVLFTALQTFKEKLIDDGNSNFAEIDSFFLDDERNSLLNRIATLESGLASARDRVLTIRSESDSKKAMGRDSCWQMCRVMLGRAFSRFFTG